MVYVAVIAVILSLRIKHDRRHDTSLIHDTSPSKAKPSVLIQFTSGLDVRLCLAVRSVMFLRSVMEVSCLQAQYFSGLEDIS